MKRNTRVKNNLSKWLKVTGILMVLVTLGRLSAHTYFEGISSMTVNQRSGNLEIVHQFTTHDLLVVLAQKYDQKVEIESANFEPLLKNYWLENFNLSKENQSLTIDWIGVEAGINLTTIYQEVQNLNNLSGLKVKHQILMDLHPEQINRLNFADGQEKGTKIFNRQNKTIGF